MPVPSSGDTPHGSVAEVLSGASQEDLSADTLRRHNRLLYEIVSQTDGDFDTQMRRALARTTELLGLHRGTLARVAQEQYTIELCHCPDGSLKAGQVFDLEDTYCSLVLESDGLIAIDHLGASHFRKRRCYEVLALESYIGTPVRYGEQLYGALAFSGKVPKDPPFNEADRSLVRLLGQWVGTVLGRRRAEQALARSNEALRHRNRELQDFAHIASHDLQEPLRKVRAFASLMREDYADEVDADGRYYLERMEDGAERMSRLVSDLLSLSRVTTGRHAFEPVSLRAVAEEVRADLELRIEETGARVEIGALPTVEANRTQMRQLLQNLVGNALKFHRAGVPPVVEVRAEPAADAGRCRLVVEDNGIGFEEKFLDRIFTPLQRLHGRDAYEGTGIGLAVCRRIAERHEGTIAAESTPGCGSRFIVTLPRHRAAHPAAAPGGDLPETGDAPAR